MDIRVSCALKDKHDDLKNMLDALLVIIDSGEKSVAANPIQRVDIAKSRALILERCMVHLCADVQ